MFSVGSNFEFHKMTINSLTLRYLLEYEKKKRLGKSELVECNRMYDQFDVDGLKLLS